MLLPPAIRDQDRQPSNPFGARKPRPDEVNQTEPEPWRVVNGIATIAGRKRTELPEPTPQHISDHDMIMRDLPMGGRLSKFCQQWPDETLDALIAGLAGFSTLKPKPIDEWRPCHVQSYNESSSILTGDGWGVWVENAMFQRDPDDIVGVLPGDPVEVLFDDNQNAIAWRRAPA